MPPYHLRADLCRLVDDIVGILNIFLPWQLPNRTLFLIEHTEHTGGQVYCNTDSVTIQFQFSLEN